MGIALLLWEMNLLTFFAQSNLYLINSELAVVATEGALLQSGREYLSLFEQSLDPVIRSNLAVGVAL